MTCNPPFNDGYKYIIMDDDYFTKWDEVMPTLKNMTYTKTHLFFNHVITCFKVPQQLVLDHEKRFENEVFWELSSLLGFTHNFTSPHYPQTNGQV
jgi:hypothetical protein